MKKFIKNVKISFVRIYFMMFWMFLLFNQLLCFNAGAEKINFDKESFLDEVNLRNKIIYDTCEGKSKCIDGFKKGEFGVNEIGIKKYDLNNDDTKDDALVCFYSNYFCGARTWPINAASSHPARNTRALGITRILQSSAVFDLEI